MEMLNQDWVRRQFDISKDKNNYRNDSAFNVGPYMMTSGANYYPETYYNLVEDQGYLVDRTWY